MTTKTETQCACNCHWKYNEKCDYCRRDVRCDR